MNSKYTHAQTYICDFKIDGAREMDQCLFFTQLRFLIDSSNSFAKAINYPKIDFS